MLATLEMRNKIFFSGLSVLVFVVLLTFGLGWGQEQGFKTDHELYQDVKLKLQQQNFRVALPELVTLLRNHPDSYLLNWDYAFANAKSGDNAAASHYYTQIRLLRPAMVQNPLFLVEFAEVLYIQGEGEKAQAYLTRAKLVSNNDPEVSKEADLLLGKITASGAGQRGN